jgi:hypothetical protein
MRSGAVRYGQVWSGMAVKERHCEVWLDVARLGGHGMMRYGKPGYGLVWPGEVLRSRWGQVCSGLVGRVRVRIGEAVEV